MLALALERRGLCPRVVVVAAAAVVGTRLSERVVLLMQRELVGVEVVMGATLIVQP